MTSLDNPQQNSNVIQLACGLIKRSSITPDDQGCQSFIAERLANAGFAIQHLPFEDVANLWAFHGSGSPVFAFLGHTDVVPTGPAEQWQFPPFEPTIHNNYLYGRGAADMKSSVAAMVIALEQFVIANPNHPGTIGILLTSDEEGPAINGIVKAIEQLHQEQLTIDYCLVGEPSSLEIFGDTIRIGRRGSLNGHLTVHGTQGHTAYPKLANNPIHAFSSALKELCDKVWDNGNEAFPATTFQISNIKAGTGATNVIPGQLEVDFNFRYGTASTKETLKTITEAILQKHQINNHEIEWRSSGDPYLTEKPTLKNAVTDAIYQVTGVKTDPSTGGGTSDGRFIAPYGTEVIEFGPSNKTIHKIDERIALEELEKLPKIYQSILDQMMK